MAGCANKAGSAAPTSSAAETAKDASGSAETAKADSSGDVSMHMYTITNNPYRSDAFMLIADNEELDYGNTEKTRELGKEWEADGFHVISMKDDFRTIYGDNVTKTGSFHWEEELAEDRTPAESAN